MHAYIKDRLCLQLPLWHLLDILTIRMVQGSSGRCFDMSPWENIADRLKVASRGLFRLLLYNYGEPLKVLLDVIQLDNKLCLSFFLLCIWFWTYAWYNLQGSRGVKESILLWSQNTVAIYLGSSSCLEIYFLSQYYKEEFWWYWGSSYDKIIQHPKNYLLTSDVLYCYSSVSKQDMTWAMLMSTEIKMWKMTSIADFVHGIWTMIKVFLESIYFVWTSVLQNLLTRKERIVKTVMKKITNIWISFILSSSKLNWRHLCTEKKLQGLRKLCLVCSSFYTRILLWLTI